MKSFPTSVALEHFSGYGDGVAQWYTFKVILMIITLDALDIKNRLIKSAYLRTAKFSSKGKPYEVVSMCYAIYV